jgi:membrane associated rhomboid family serine protease
MAGSFIQNIKEGFFKADILRRLIYINIGVFLVVNIYLIIVALSGNEAWLATTGTDLFLGSTSNIKNLIWRPWSVITYMFTHVDLWHIAWNLLIFYWFGRLFLEFIGQRKLLAVYLLSGISGFILYFIAFNIFDRLPVDSTIIGASAAIMGIVTAVATYMPNYKMNLLFLGPVKLQYIALVYVLIDLVSLRTMVNTGGHLGHLGGALYGFFWGMQMRTGKDIASGFEQFLDRFFTFFRGGGVPFSVIRNKKATRSNSFKSDEEFNAEKKKTQERIDAILDKISKAGYDSLTKAEKDFLFRHSKD